MIKKINEKIKQNTKENKRSLLRSILSRYDVNDVILLTRVKNSIVISVSIVLLLSLLCTMHYFSGNYNGFILEFIILLFMPIFYFLVAFGKFRLAVDIFFVTICSIGAGVLLLANQGFIPWLHMNLPVFYPYFLLLGIILIIGNVAVKLYQVIVSGILIVVPIIVMTSLNTDSTPSTLVSYYSVLIFSFVSIYFSYMTFNQLEQTSSILMEKSKLTQKLILDNKILEYNKNRANESEKAKSHFLAVLSHEIKTPLNGIIGYAEILRCDHLTDSQMEFVDIIANSAENLLGMFSDLLSIANMQNFTGTNHYHESNPLELIKNIYFKLSKRMNTENIEFILEKSDDFPDTILSDTEKLSIIIEQILSNSIKFTVRGTISVSCDRCTERGREYIRFKFKDNGVGIPEDKLGMIFDNFMQADSSSTRRFNGLGIGLSIVKGFVHLLDGVVTISSKVNEYTKVEIQIPNIKN